MRTRDDACPFDGHVNESATIPCHRKRQHPARLAGAARQLGDMTMLKTIDPLLNAEVLHALAAMGQGDALVVVDRHFPAEAIARQTVIGRPLRMGGVSVECVVRAVLSLLPLDTAAVDAAIRMEVAGDHGSILPQQMAVQETIDAAEGHHVPLLGVERHAFHARARNAFALIHTDEPRPYGCFIFTKGALA